MKIQLCLLDLQDKLGWIKLGIQVEGLYFSSALTVQENFAVREPRVILKHCFVQVRSV